MSLNADDLPQDWTILSDRRAADLRAQARRELAKGAALSRADFTVVAAYAADDTVLIDAPDLSPRYYLMHLSWTKDPTEAHPVPDLSELAALVGPDPATVDQVTLWTDLATEKGLAMVQHRVDGGQIIDVQGWTGDTPPATTRDLEAANWSQITGPLHPKAEWDGVMVPTGQLVEYWVRPVTDDFILMRAIHTPGEAITLSQLVPARDDIVEFANETTLEQALPPDQFCRAVSPIHPGYGRAGFPSTLR